MTAFYQSKVAAIAAIGRLPDRLTKAQWSQADIMRLWGRSARCVDAKGACHATRHENGSLP
jgi:hypothetical protein